MNSYMPKVSLHTPPGIPPGDSLCQRVFQLKQGILMQLMQKRCRHPSEVTALQKISPMELTRPQRGYTFGIAKWQQEINTTENGHM